MLKVDNDNSGAATKRENYFRRHEKFSSSCLLFDNNMILRNFSFRATYGDLMFEVQGECVIVRLVHKMYENGHWHF